MGPALIRPEPGKALLYVDYRAQEPHIAAYLTGGKNMIAAVQPATVTLVRPTVGLVPRDATKASHKTYRDLVLKPFFLSVNYAPPRRA